MSGKRKSASEAKQNIVVTVMEPSWKKALPGFTRKLPLWCKAALTAKARGDLSVVLASDDFVQDLNRTYRGKNRSTNVLSFAGSGGNIGDIILAYGVIMNEAALQHKTFLQHTAHLVVHGCLHLQGFDHENDREAEAMEQKETAILRKLGFPSPYEIRTA